MPKFQLGIKPTRTDLPQICTAFRRFRQPFCGLEITDVFRGHSAYIWSLACHPSGKSLFSGASDGKIISWPLDAPAAYVERITDRDNQIQDLELIPSKRLLVGSQLSGTRLTVWEAESFQRAQVIDVNKPVRSIAVVDREHRTSIAIGHADGSVGLVDLGTGEESWLLEEPLGGLIEAVAYTRQGELLAVPVPPVNGSAKILLLGLDRVRIVATLDVPNELIMCLAWSGDGKWLAAAVGQDVFAWHAASNWAPQRFPGHTGRVECVTFSPDGRTLASCSQDATIRFVDLTTGQPIDKPLTAHAGIVWELTFSERGDYLYSVSGDGTLGIWDVGAKRLRARLPGQPDGIKSLLLGPNGDWLATGGIWEGLLQVWRIKPFRDNGFTLRQ